MEDSWDLTPIYRTEADFDVDYERLKGEGFKKIIQYQGALEGQLNEALDQYFSYIRALEKLYTYAHLASDADINDSDKRARLDRASSLYYEFNTKTNWFRPELLSLDHLSQTGLYGTYLYRVQREKAHTLSAQEEKLMALHAKSTRVRSVFSLFNNVDLTFDSVEDSEGKLHPLSHASYANLLKSNDRTLRKNAFLTYYQSYDSVKNTLAENLYANVLNNEFIRTARAYDTALEASLYSNEIPTNVYFNLIKEVEENLEPLNDYIAWKKKALHLDEFHPWDLFAEPFEENDLTFTKEEAVEIVLKAIEPLGEEYVAIARKGLKEERWIDWFERPAKRSGGYSSGCYDTYPYILLNFTGSIRDLFTLVHELGHSMHSYYTRKHQPYVYGDYTIFVAEVASLFHEEMLFNYLNQKYSDPKLQNYLIHVKAENFRSTLYAQTLYAHFEIDLQTRAQNEESINQKVMSDIWKGLSDRYYGKEMIWHPLLGLNPLRIPHFYSSFYTYQYAIGISAALTFYDKLIEEPKIGKEKYLEFISTGSSLNPIETLNRAGIDMTSAEPIKKAIANFNRVVRKLKYD